MIKAILLDDERSCTESLAVELKTYTPEVEVIGKYNFAKDALIALQKERPDVIFLDIEMPWMNGFEFLLSVGDIDFAVIFVTAYDEFAIKAFKFNAIDYLLKPIQKEELIKAVEKLKKHHLTRINSSFLKEAQSQNYAFDKLALPTMNGLSFVTLSEILYCRSDSNYTSVFLVNGKETIVSKTLKSISDTLEGTSFLRIHQSYLVNMQYVERYIKGQGGELVMSNGEHLPVARSKRSELLERVTKR